MTVYDCANFRSFHKKRALMARACRRRPISSCAQLYSLGHVSAVSFAPTGILLLQFALFQIPPLGQCVRLSSSNPPPNTIPRTEAAMFAARGPANM